MSCTRSNTREDEPLRPKPKRCCCGNCGAAAALRSSRASTDPGNSAAWRWGAGQGVGAVGPTRRTVEARDPGAGAARRWGTGPRSGRGWAKERAAAAKAAQGQGTGEVSSSVMFYWNLIFLWSFFCRHACSCSHQSLLWAKSKGLISHLEVVIPTGPTIIYIVPWRTGHDIPPPIIETVSSYLNMVGVKECVRHERVYTGKGITVWSGNDDECHDSRWKYGATGVISVASNLVPGLVMSYL
jgi:hypothetical protein